MGHCADQSTERGRREGRGGQGGAEDRRGTVVAIRKLPASSTHAPEHDAYRYRPCVRPAASASKFRLHPR